MKQLYISDLDGTLLGEDKKPSAFTIKTVNHLVQQGMFFSIATARTAVSVTNLVKDIRFTIPVVLMNGVCLYDIAQRHYVSVEYIPKESLLALLNCLDQHEKIGFFYAIEQDALFTYYFNVHTPNAAAFIQERKKLFGKQFVKLSSVSELDELPIAFFSVSDTESRLKPIYNALRQIPGLHCDFYRDNYHPGFWYLEACSASASKAHAVEKLKALYQFEHVTAFGDNLNDIPLFSVSDECIAVQNAQHELKQLATRVVLPNTSDGVAHELLRLYMKKLRTEQ